MNQFYYFFFFVFLLPVLGFSQQYSSQAKHNIDANLDGAISAFPIDLDGDGDMDVVGVAYQGDDVVWYQNNGSQSFTKITIDGNFNTAISILTAIREKCRYKYCCFEQYWLHLMELIILD